MADWLWRVTWIHLPLQFHIHLYLDGDRRIPVHIITARTKEEEVISGGSKYKKGRKDIDC